MTRADWLARRKEGIGSSDAPAVVGVCPWRTALEVYLDKTSQRRDVAPNDAMRMGTFLEPVVARLYAEQTGQRLEKPPAIIAHDEHPWMIASIDWRWAEEEGKPVECKTTGIHGAKDWGEPGTDEIPENYQIQVQHQLAVLGQDEADVAVLIGGQDFRVYTVQRRQNVIDRLIEIEADFWARVQKRIPPTPDWDHPTTPALIAAMRPLDAMAEIELPAEAIEFADAYKRLGETIHQAEKEREYAKARLIELLGTAGIGHLADGRTVTRSQVNRKEYTVKASSYFKLLVKEPKKEKAHS